MDVGSNSGMMRQSAVWGCVSLISVYLGSVLNHRKEVVWGVEAGYFVMS